MELRATHRDSEARIHDLEAQYGDLEAKYSDLVAQSSDLEASHNTVLARNTNLEGRTTELQRENARLQKELDDTRRELTVMKEKEEDSEPCILPAGSVERALDESMRHREEESQEHSRVVKNLQRPDEKSNEEADGAFDEGSDAAPASNDDETFAQLQDVDGCNLAHFLGNEGVNAFGVPESELKMKLPCMCSKQRALKALRKIISEPRILDNSWICIGPELIWSSGMTKCLLVLHSQLYDVDSGTTTDIVYDDRVQENQVRDLFHTTALPDATGKPLFYRGTFRCTGQSIVSYRHIKPFIKDQPNVFRTIVQRTTRSSQAATQAALKDMYENEQLKIACYRLEKVGENREIMGIVEACERDSQENTRKHPAQRTDNGSRKKRKLA